VVAATHRDLEAQVGAETFRADLFARLAGWVIRVAPLRDRREDVLRLAAAILEETTPPWVLSTAAAEALLLHDWPFNVRELEQTLRQAIILADGAAAIELEHLPEPLRAHIASPPGDQAIGPGVAIAPLSTRIDPRRTPSRDELCEVLAHFGGRVRPVAEFFGKDRRQVYRWMSRYGIPLRSGDAD